MFYSGDFYFGESIWGPSSPVRTNPDIDGVLIPIYTPGGQFNPAGYDSGAFIRTEGIKAEFSPSDIIEEGSFTKTTAPIGKIDRLK